jgi:hypothetical protein
MRDIRLESLYAKIPVSLPLCIVIALIYIYIYNTSQLQTKSNKRVWGARIPREGKGAKGLRKEGKPDILN